MSGTDIDKVLGKISELLTREGVTDPAEQVGVLLGLAVAIGEQSGATREDLVGVLSATYLVAV